MAVRSTRSTTNIRQKLSELQQPVGTTGAALLATNTAQEAYNILQCGRKNLIINGDMSVWQRGTSVTFNNGTNPFLADRWFHASGTTSMTNAVMDRVADAPPGQGFKYSLRITNNGATAPPYAVTAYSHIQQTLENSIVSEWSSSFGTANAKYVTLSFWAKSSVAGTPVSAGFRMANLSTSATCFHCKQIDRANVWQKFTFVYPPLGFASNIAGDTDQIGQLIVSPFAQVANGSPLVGTTATYNGVWETGLNVLSGPGGNNNTWIATNGATIQFTGFQLEIGKVATPFEFRGYAQELSLCQRYYQRNKLDSGQYGAFLSGTAYNAGTFYGTYHLQVPMRISPTSLGYSSLSHFQVLQTNVSTNPVINAFAIDNGSGTQTLRVYATTPGATGLTVGSGAWIQSNSTSAYIDFSSEF